MIVLTEIGEGRDRFHRDALDFAVGIEIEGDVGWLECFIVETSLERVVLPMVECAVRPKECGKLIVSFPLFARMLMFRTKDRRSRRRNGRAEATDRLWPAVRFFSEVPSPRWRVFLPRNRAISPANHLSLGQDSDRAIRTSGRDELAVFAVDLDREADIFSRQEHDRGTKPSTAPPCQMIFVPR